MSGCARRGSSAGWCKKDEALYSSPNHQPLNSTKDGRYQVSYPDDDDYRDEHDDPTRPTGRLRTIRGERRTLCGSNVRSNVEPETKICASGRKVERKLGSTDVDAVVVVIIVVGMRASSGRVVSDRRRLYQKGRILGHKRGKRNSRPNQSLVQIDGVDSKEAARSYLGKVSIHTDARSMVRQRGWRCDRRPEGAAESLGWGVGTSGDASHCETPQPRVCCRRRLPSVAVPAMRGPALQSAVS